MLKGTSGLEMGDVSGGLEIVADMGCFCVACTCDVTGCKTGGRIVFILISGVMGHKSDWLIVMTFAGVHIIGGH